MGEEVSKDMTEVITEARPIRKRIDKAPVPLKEALVRYLKLKDDIGVILGIYNRATVARSLGVHAVTVWRWQNGRREPSLLLALCIQVWADKIREEQNQ